MITEKIFRAKNTMKVLGVLMDSTLTWNDHINKTVNNIQSKIHAIRCNTTKNILLLFTLLCFKCMVNTGADCKPKIKTLFSLREDPFSYKNWQLQESSQTVYKSVSWNVAKLQTSDFTLQSQHHYTPFFQLVNSTKQHSP